MFTKRLTKLAVAELDELAWALARPDVAEMCSTANKKAALKEVLRERMLELVNQQRFATLYMDSWKWQCVTVFTRHFPFLEVT